MKTYRLVLDYAVTADAQAVREWADAHALDPEASTWLVADVVSAYRAGIVGEFSTRSNEETS